MALILTLIAIAIAVIAASTFSTASSTSRGISQNAGDHVRSRLIAESGMVASIANIKRQPEWRTTLTSGEWASDVAYNGGTFTVSGVDGVDTDNDGVIEGDGDLADDTTDPVTVTVTGSYNGVTHSISAILYDGGGVVPVTQVGALDKVEVKGHAVIDSWNSASGSYVQTKSNSAIISTSSRKKEKLKFKDEALIGGSAYAPTGSDPDVVIKVDNNATITGETGTQAIRQKVPSVDPPNVGAPQGNLTIASGTTTVSADMSVNDMEIKNNANLMVDADAIIYVAGNLKIKDYCDIYVADGARVSFYVEGEIKIEGNADVNTDTNDPSRVIFYSLGKKKVELQNDVEVFAVFVAPGAEVKLKDDAELYGSFVGRKLKVEHEAKLHQDLNPITVPAGTVIFDNGGADYGLAAHDQMELKGDCRVSGYNGATARVSINNNDSNKLKIENGVLIDGDVYVGPGGDPAVVIDCSGSPGDYVTGDVGISELSVAVDWEDQPVNGFDVDHTYDAGSHTISSDQQFDKLTIKEDAVVTISGDVTIQCDDDFKMEDSAELRVTTGSKLTLYCAKDCDVTNQSRFNVTSGDPTAVEIYVLGTDKMEVKDDAIVYATVTVPQDEFNLKDDAHFYGTVRAHKIKIEHRAHAHIATETGAGPPDTGTGEMRVRWRERR